MLRRFVGQGHLPHIAALLAGGTSCDVIPTMPALTAPGWMSIASGAGPTALGVENILLPTPGGKPNEIRNGFDASLSQAEFLWERLGRAGLNAIVVKYPGSWPPRPGRFVQIDGAGGYADLSCQFEAIGSCAYATGDRPASNESTRLFPKGYRDHWRIDTGDGGSLLTVRPRPPVGWRNLPAGFRPACECHLSQTHDPRPFHALAGWCDGKRTLLLAHEKNGAAATKLHVGDWSGWFAGRSRRGDFKFRFKLVSLEPELGRIHLYRSEGHLLSGFSKPPELADGLVEAVGPPVEWAGTFDVMNGLIDLDGQLEIYRDHTRWLAETMRWLCRRGDWHGLFTHWHLIEYAHHLVGASLSEDHPRHDPATAARHLDFLLEVYRLADSLVGVARDLADERTLIVIASDHGHDLVHSLFFINHWLIGRGYLFVEGDEIDWTRTVAYGLFPGAIFINVAERWSTGFLSPDQADAIAVEIAAELRALVDPRTGRTVVSHVLDRAGLAAWKVHGPRAPDLTVCLERGYETASRIDYADWTTLFEVTTPLREVTSGHGSFHPDSPSARTIALFNGPGVPPGRHYPTPVSVLDLAPTICAHLGLDGPRDSEGMRIPFEDF